MQEYTTFLRGVLDTYKYEGVGAADLVQFAGAVGITQCPGGPKVRAVSYKAVDIDCESLSDHFV